MDGIDGIVGGVALVNALFLFALPHFAGAGALLPAFAGATLGFLVWNLSPASIFLGDAGSHFVGFFLAAAALYAPVGDVASPFALLVACVVVFVPFLFDTAYTLARRLRTGKNVFSAHREHVYQRITPSPAMHRRTSNLYYGAAVVSGLAALLVAHGSLPSVVAGLLLAVLPCALLAALPRVLESRGG
jgi:UDP-N-acetylmuramyl pentapeptide phosphotransferase/UDP-N-acetylglucosamine-1-phosphate transferase